MLLAERCNAISELEPSVISVRNTLSPPGSIVNTSALGFLMFQALKFTNKVVSTEDPLTQLMNTTRIFRSRLHADDETIDK